MTQTPHRVAILLSDNVLATSATLPIEILRTAEGSAIAHQRDARPIDVQILSVDGQPVNSSSGFALSPTAALNDDDNYDLVHIPGLWRNPRPILARFREWLPWLRRQHDQGAMISAVGTGSCFLAAAGLLDNRPATTHWHYFDQFQRDYPQVQLQRQYFITRSENLYCAASVNSLAELMVHIIYRWYGRSVANLVQRNFFHEIRNSYELSNCYGEESDYLADESILQALIWMKDNFYRAVSIKSLAQQFNMSVRTFNRRFKNALGKAPLDYLQVLRLNNIKELLQHTNLTLAEIANRCGYQDVAHLTKLFRRHFNTTPGQYRGTVRAKLFTIQ